MSENTRRRPPRSCQWYDKAAAASIIVYATIYTSIISISTTHAFSAPSNNINSSSNNLPPPPPFKSPQTPEEVVMNQLHHFQTSNLPAAYEINSPENKEATGSISDFELSLQKPPYNLLLNHERADVLMEVLPDAYMEDEESRRNNNDEHGQHYDTSLCLVCIRPNRQLEKSNNVWFWWELSRYGIDEENNEAMGNDYDGEVQWMVDCVIPDFEDLDFETDSLSIEEFGEGDDDDDDELTIYWDVGGL